MPSAPRVCSQSGCPQLVRAGDGRCPEHRRQASRDYDATRRVPRSAMYGPEHKRERARLASLVASGSATCARCTLPIRPGQPWDVGHLDGGGPHDYAGPEHRSCNRATSQTGVGR